jgi:hypothetical protein
MYSLRELTQFQEKSGWSQGPSPLPAGHAAAAAAVAHQHRIVVPVTHDHGPVNGNTMSGMAHADLPVNGRHPDLPVDRNAVMHVDDPGAGPVAMASVVITPADMEASAADREADGPTGLGRRGEESEAQDDGGREGECSSHGRFPF